MRHALITVRENSTRLPKKCFLDLGGKTVLEHVILRCLHFDLTPIVSTVRGDNDIIALCQTMGVPYYAGAASDKLERWERTVRAQGIRQFITVDCDDPFFDPGLAHSMFDVVINDYAVMKPDMRAYLGSHGWLINALALRKICAKKTSMDTEMIWKHIPDDVPVQQFDARPEWIEQRIRLTLDYEEDYWLIRTVLRELGPFAERAAIVGFFRDNPGLATVNLFRNEEWKQNQQNG